MNYIARYGMEFNPFIKNSKEIFISTQQYQEVKYRLDHLLMTKGFGIITGASGHGKTTSIRNWINTLNPASHKIVYVSLSTLTVNEFYRNLMTHFQLEPYFQKTKNFKAIQSQIKRLVVEKKQTPIIIFDEANHMQPGILNDLKMLFNFDMDSQDKAVVILAGLPQLNHTLNLSTNEALKQRIIMNYNIESMSRDEAKKYINEKLNGAGCHQKVFEEGALEALINCANGVPRVLNKLCDRVLMLGDSKGVNIIDREIAMMAINDIELG